GVEQNLLPPQARDLILGGAIFSIIVNPILFTLLAGVARPASPAPAAPAPKPASDLVPTRKTGHVVLAGYGRVGSSVAEGLTRAGHAVVMVDADEEARRRAAAAGLEVLDGNAADPVLLEAAG